MRKFGIFIIIFLLIASGTVAILYQRSKSRIAAPPPGEEIIIAPTLPAAEPEAPVGLKLSFVPDSAVSKYAISMAPASSVHTLSAAGADGSLNFLFEGLYKPKEGKLNAWPELLFVYNIRRQENVSIRIKTEETLPPYFSLRAGPNLEILQFDAQGISVQAFSLEPGARLLLGVVIDLSDNISLEEGRHLTFTIMAD